MNLAPEKMQPVIFGEVLFDCFPKGEKILGGAPFNVAWHLQAFKDQPLFISRVGEDELGRDILKQMQHWGMTQNGVQMDSLHPTGQVNVEFENNEPHYTITPDVAYDFIDKNLLPSLKSETLLYHGTLALRNADSRQALQKLAQDDRVSIFLDVNLRDPWWNREEVISCLEQASWAKLNEDELHRLFPGPENIKSKMLAIQLEMELDLLLITRGEKGAIACTSDAHFVQVVPEPVTQLVDTVGAGDAFTAVTLHGLVSGWPLQDTLNKAQEFASQIIGIRGATPEGKEFYRQLVSDKETA